MTRIRREAWVAFLVLLHLVVTPCATAMVMMPADADCHHCHSLDGLDVCLQASEVTDSALNGLAFDPGRTDPPLAPATLAFLPGALDPQAAAFRAWSRAYAVRHSGDPPLYLRLGQLRN